MRHVSYAPGVTCDSLWFSGHADNLGVRQDPNAEIFEQMFRCGGSEGFGVQRDADAFKGGFSSVLLSPKPVKTSGDSTCQV